MFEKPDETDPEDFSGRRDLAESYEGRCSALKDCFAFLHGKVMAGEFTEPNALRAIQTMEKLHRTVSKPADPEADTEPLDTEEAEDPYAYDHTNRHRKLAEMSDADLLSHVEELVGAVERKSLRSRIAQPERTRSVVTNPFSEFGETVPAPPKTRKRWRH